MGQALPEGNYSRAPDEAMSAAWAQVEGAQGLTLSLLEAAVDAAAPFIRNQEHQRLNEALEEKWPQGASDEFKNGFDDALKCLEAAALDTPDPSGEREG